ncbi:hypothetical protein GCM10009678_55050 [Actinomadura kijaniata]|uniref:Uncharacterized protein n=1 Tax=Actinomadura namibiensis TaxID=182080 RepID=A0A7W3LLL4_ACTNM|nr:rhomboid-like protein [Actinomadura namibiensis]MBA8950280.1 hypothetical protein [Actinomadura namibiensis]
MRDPADPRARLARWARERAVALGYLGALGVAEAGYRLLGERERAAVAAWASTNLDNLVTHAPAALPLSAVVPLEHPLLWLGLAAVALPPVTARLGNARTALLFGLTHTVGTAVSQGIVWWRVTSGDLPDSARQMLDTGASYVVAPALLTAVAFAPWRWRIPAGAGLAVLLPFLFDGLAELEVSAVGHTVSLALAVPLYLALRRPPGAPAAGPGDGAPLASGLRGAV